MNKKTLYLITGILGLVVFIGYLGEPGPKKLLGLSLNIWVFRLGWLLVCVVNLRNYWKIRQSEQQSNP